jgi:hypothetical protein
MFCGAVQAQERPKTPQPAIPELIRLLGSERFQEREAAQAALRSRDEALFDLRRAQPTLNPEGRRRAQAIIDEFNRQRSERFLQYGRDGRVDVFVEWASLAGDQIDPAKLWQCVLDVARQQIDNSGSNELKRQLKSSLKARTFADLLEFNPTFKNLDGDGVDTGDVAMHFALCGKAKLKGNILANSVVVSTGPVDLDFAMNCIVLATGNVKINLSRNVLAISDKEVQVNFPSKRRSQPGFTPWSCMTILCNGRRKNGNSQVLLLHTLI